MTRSVVAIGVFDGVHRGHVAILERAVRLARERGLATVVVSFDPHPDVVLAKTFRAQPPLTPLPEKRARLAALGVDRLDVLPFTRELAALDPEAFIERHLVGPHQPEVLVVGENFALGRARAGNPSRLAEIGTKHDFTVEPVALEWVDGAPVSSTRIRDLLGAGRVEEAAHLLGRRYGLSGLVVTGDGIGRSLGVPTANLRLHEEKLVPGNGIYAAWARLPGETRWRPAAMSIGVRPTFGGQSRTLEVHVLDWDGDLRGKDVDVEMARWLRPELRFDGADELIVAMQGDLAEVRRVLAASEESSTTRSGR